MSLPIFPSTVVGSWPRPALVMKGLRAKREGRMSQEDFDKIADEAVLDTLCRQVDAGIDIVSDGEHRRDNFISFIAEKLKNVNMLTVAELLDYVEDKASFEEILGTLDVPAYSLSNPAAVGKISRRKPIALNEYKFLRSHTDRAIKVALPGPYLLTRSMWVQQLSKEAYPTKEDLSVDIVKVLREELDDLINAGVDFVQFDEPVLTELVFTQKNANRTFMCGALAAKSDTEEELKFATGLINQVTEEMRGKGTRVGVHICRGNWSRDEAVLLKGPYYPLLPYLSQMKVDQLILEYSTPRAGELDALGKLSHEIGLGVVNPRTSDVESVEQVVARVREALHYIPEARLFLNPDCGFGTFAQRPMNNADIATEKLKVIVKAAERLRHGG